MVEYKQFGTSRIDVGECRSVREFFNEIRDYDIPSDDNTLFIEYRDGTTYFSGNTEKKPKKTDVAKAIFGNDYCFIHFNGTVIETADSTGHVFVEVA